MKIYLYKYTFFVATLIVLGITSCSKDNSSTCNEINGGFIALPTATLWMSKDLGVGKLELISLYDATDKVDVQMINNGVMSKYFTKQPTCAADGTIHFQLSKNHKVEYKLKAENGQTYDGWIKAPCSEDCIFYDIAE